MLGETVSGQSRVATPGRRKKTPVMKHRVGKIWANTGPQVEWMDAKGTPHAEDLITPPDPDTLDDEGLYPGGSDGRSNFMLAVGDDFDENLYVDKFNRDFTDLVDRWLIPDWPHDPASGLNSRIPDYSIQHVSASDTRVVAIVDLFDPDDHDAITDNDKHYIGVAVFDTVGTLLDQHLVYTTVSDGPDFAEGGFRSNTGSFCDGRNVYFAHEVLVDIGFGLTPETGYAKVNLSSGVLTELFSQFDINQLSPDPDVDWVDGVGIVAVSDSGSGDLILVGDNIARVTQAGTPVWFSVNPDPGAGPFHVPYYQGLARSGRNTVWAAGPPDASPITHEFSYAGLYLQASAFIEPVNHMWLGPK